MAPTAAELLKRNEAYAATHVPMRTIEQIEANGTPPPKTCIITCVDPRMCPEEFLGLKKGEAFVFRTIAGHPQPVFLNVVTLDTVSKGLEDIILIYHTDCGAMRFPVPKIRSDLSSRQPSMNTDFQTMTFGAISTSMEEALEADVLWLKEQQLLRQGLEKCIKGYIFDLKTGTLRQVV